MLYRSKKGMKIYMKKDKGEQLQERTEHTHDARREFGTEVGEDSTKYGEFVSSYFAWISLPDQKEKAEEMQQITKKKNAKKTTQQKEM